jgi:hypothetical protein
VRLSKNDEQRRGRQAADESPLQVHRHHPGVSARIAQKLGFDPPFVGTVFRISSQNRVER